MSRAVRYARLSIFSNTFLILIKVVVGLLSGSVSIISEAIHSLMDLLAAIIAYFSVKFSNLPPDEDHSFGHEKIENVSAVIEALLIFAASALIIYKAVMKMVSGEAVESIGLGVFVMFISATVNFFVARKLYKVAREENSIALEADALHLKVDVYTSAGVAIGLFLIWITKLNFLDPVVAIVIAVVILKESYDMLKRAFHPLLDGKLSDDEIRIIKEIVMEKRNIPVNLHNIRTRCAGKVKHVDFHMTLPAELSVKESHEICNMIEAEIEKKLKHTRVLIHVEPEGDDN